MDCLQGYEHNFHSREFKETFSTQSEAANAISSIYLTVRWRALHFNYRIPKEHQREIPPGSRCFATLTLAYVFNGVYVRGSLRRQLNANHAIKQRLTESFNGEQGRRNENNRWSLFFPRLARYSLLTVEMTTFSSVNLANCLKSSFSVHSVVKLQTKEVIPPKMDTIMLFIV